VQAPAADPRSFSSAPHLGFTGSDHRHRIGVRRTDEAGWLEPDEHRAWQLSEKRRLVAEDRRAYVLPAMTPAAERGTDRLVALLEPLVGPDLDPDRDPIERCGLATQEDWCLMVREDSWRLRAACLCLPSRWVLADKVGGTLSEIHQPVPRYDAELGAVEPFFDRLAPDRIVWRTNWNVWDDARLCQPFTEDEAVAHDLPEVAEVAERVVLRVERQTLRRLTEDCIAFSIRVHQRPLGWLVAQPGAIDLLRESVGVGSDPGRAAAPTKKLGHLAPVVRAWLSQVDGAPR
jgi:hypothetical protein